MKINPIEIRNRVTIKIMVCSAFSLSALSAVAQKADEAKINIGLVYPLSSDGTTAKTATNKFSFNILAGVSAKETGFTLAGVSNIVKNNTQGLQIAGFSNHVGHSADGAMIAGFLNTCSGGNGFALAGFGNFAGKSSGAQLAGFINTGGNVSSFQLAGFMNYAANVKGSQFAGFINKAKNIRGVQFSGFINIADTAGCQIGLINISKNGEISISSTIDESRTVLLSLRSGGKIVYGILGAGYNLKNKKDVYAYEAGFGLHIVRADIFRLNTELTTTSLLDFKKTTYYRSALALLPTIRIGNRIDIFAGPSFNYINTNSAEDRELHQKYTSSWTRNNGKDFYGFNIGYTAGLAIKI